VGAGVTTPGVVGFDSLELWVGNVRQTASLFRDVLGFAVIHDDGRSAGDDRTSCSLQQGRARIVVTQATAPGSAVAEYVRVHGDGVKDVGFTVRDVDDAFHSAVRRGAAPIRGPRTEGGRRQATVAAFGDTTHTLFAPTVEARSIEGEAAGLQALDHLAVSVEAGSREHWARFYQDVFGFDRIGRDDRFEIDGSAFNMATVRGPDGSPTLVLAEPAPGSRPSQIADYLDRFGGPGVHHVAFATDDIFATVGGLRTRGLRLLEVPPGYYEEARRRLAGLDVSWDALERSGILVDRDGDGHLFQVFTEPLGDRPTVHLELIQRAGSQGFGNENVRALYHAVVREQHAREAEARPGRSVGGSARSES
jgi:4-hydroxyphenylpyruvate dioxygenase